MKSLEEVTKIKTDAEADLLKLPGVTGVDVGYRYVDGKKTDQLAIRVYVKDKSKMTDKNAIPREIKGVPTDVIERNFVLHQG